MSSHRDSVDQKLATLVERYDIRGTVAEGGHRSRLYDRSSRVFTAEITCEERHGTFAVYTGPLHPDIDFLFAFRWLLDTASQAQEESYERWSKENLSFYEHEIGEEKAQALYTQDHEVYERLVAVLGEEVYRVCSEALR